MAPKTTPFEAFVTAVEIAGGQTKFAALCGCTQGNIWQLLNNKSPLPARYVIAAEAGTGISRHILRPDIYPPHEVAA
jgi:DNA-binding transcriptional regulator YdaS (Cro superfamily)